MNNDLIVSQYQKLKEEQLERIKFRDNLIIIQIGSVGSIVSFILSKDNINRPFFDFGYMLIPWISCLISWLYYSQDEKIKEIKEFLSSGNKNNNYRDCDWESHPTKTRRIALLIFIDVIAFLFPSIISIVRAFIAIHHTTSGYIYFLYAIWGACVIIVIITMVIMILSYRSKSPIRQNNNNSPLKKS